MGRLNKALQRIKNQESRGKATATRIGPRTTLGGAADATFQSEYSKKFRSVLLDHESLIANRIITDEMHASARTSFKMLRTRLLQNMRANGWQSIAVTSPAQGDGKTVTAINLAISLAGDVNQNVCLVDLDLHHSKIAQYLGIEVRNGVSDCLLRSMPLEEVFLQTNLDRLLILPNYRTETQSSEILSSPAMARLAEKLVSKPDRIIIYDMPPILAADDMLAFAPFVDAVLMVVAEGKTLRTDVMKTSELLEHMNIIGTVLNRSDEKTASYY